MSSSGRGAEPTTTAAERAEAASMRTGGGSSTASGHPSELPQRTVIHEDARQKYVLVSAMHGSGKDPVFFVRGDKFAAYHKDAARPLIQELSRLSVRYEVLGGGRIEHSSADTTIKVFGFSYGFPWKDGESRHFITASILEEEYPGFTVTFSDDGY